MQSAQARREVDAADQLGEEFAEEVGQQRADGLRAARDEAPRRAMRHVAQAGSDTQYVAPGVLGHARAAVQRT